MNIEITKSKNDYSADAVKNRLIYIEKILQQLMQSMGNEIQNNNNNGAGANILEKLSFSSSGMKRIAKLNETVTIPTQFPIYINNNKKNNMLLSRGQMVAELAAAIMLANKRNS